MAKINYKIGGGNIEAVQQRIASILQDEFENQIILLNSFLPDIVYFDTDFAPDEGNIPWVAVNFLSFEENSDARSQTQYTCKFFIDVKAVGYQNLRKIIAVIRTILKSMQYLILDFDYGTISDASIISGGISFQESNIDSQGVCSGGLTFQCNIIEENDQAIPTALNSSNYESPINETDKSISLNENY